jgi:membrane-associated protein
MSIYSLFDYLIHLDKYLLILAEKFGLFIYLLLFLIIFLETGFVITPFLPGDSLLFVTGTLAAQGVLNIFSVLILLSLAAIIGDSVNYWLGNYFGVRIFQKSRFFKKEYLEKTKEFYHKHGGKTIIFARFIPIIRTFAPFVAGVGKMNYSKFFLFNVIGGIFWVILFLFGGFYFGRIPIIEKNLTIVVYSIIIISIIPIIIEFLRNKLKKKH